MENGMTVKECLELQLSEIEMINSMYPSKDELSISLPNVLSDIKAFVYEDSKYLPNQLDFTLNLSILDVKEKLEVNFCFPHDYPAVKPEIFARSVALSRIQQRQLNLDMTEYLQSLYEGDLCVFFVINWLTENAAKYFTPNCKSCEQEEKKGNSSNTDILCRMWIYSHHIYNKFKRREIVECGEDLNLTGFSLPGKPGIICVEGFKKDCNEFLQHIKQMNWKKISLVKEEIDKSRERNITKFRKFENFSEVCFEVRKGSSREYHMDMGQFLKYLGKHHCAYIFQELFGLEGQLSCEK